MGPLRHCLTLGGTGVTSHNANTRTRTRARAAHKMTQKAYLQLQQAFENGSIQLLCVFSVYLKKRASKSDALRPWEKYSR